MPLLASIKKLALSLDLYAKPNKIGYKFLFKNSKNYLILKIGHVIVSKKNYCDKLVTKYKNLIKEKNLTCTSSCSTIMRKAHFNVVTVVSIPAKKRSNNSILICHSLKSTPIRSQSDKTKIIRFKLSCFSFF